MCRKFAKITTDYMGQILAWDAGVGVIVDRLRAIGELDNTLLVISGDHTACRVCRAGNAISTTMAWCVALIVRGPGIKPGRVVDDFVNLMDLAPTFLEAGELKPPEVMTRAQAS